MPQGGSNTFAPNLSDGRNLLPKGHNCGAAYAREANSCLIQGAHPYDRRDKFPSASRSPENLMHNHHQGLIPGVSLRTNSKSPESLSQASSAPVVHFPRENLRASPGAIKRAADGELTNPPSRRSPGESHSFGPNHGNRATLLHRPGRRPPAKVLTARSPAGRNSYSAHYMNLTTDKKSTFAGLLSGTRDSGYGSRDFDRTVHPQDASIMKHAEQLPVALHPAQSRMADLNWDSDIEITQQIIQQRQGLSPMPGKGRWDIRSQPQSSPISQEQLAAEVKGIYAGLVMVEAKCINIDGQKAANPGDPLGSEQWQALIALHRTLLYEHHDFLMATQHPSANDALKGLATKYCMPARMWKHGIHAFLEVLRHRRPEAQEYMLSFIYLAYQMISLLLETVSSFTDTWIECLGDLARYRMAIEDDKEAHATWGGVAGRWYTMASDRHPAVGRLYHHLGILERPSLRKFYFYARSLTSVIPFLNAKESLNTLCSPILNDEQALRHGSRSAEAMIICFHARVFTGNRVEAVQRDGEAALALLYDQPPSRIGAYGVALAVTNIAAILSFGPSANIYRQYFDHVLNRDIQALRPSAKAVGMDQKTQDIAISIDVCESLQPLSFVVEFNYTCFNSIIERRLTKDELLDLLPYVHVMLVFLDGLHTLHSRFPFTASDANMFDHLVDNSRVDWSSLASFLNLVASYYCITSRIESFARQGVFPAGGAPLQEDYMIRGLVWAQWYFASDWFKNMEADDGSRSLEDTTRQAYRAERILYLGLRLTQKSKLLRYKAETKTFSVVEDDSVSGSSISDSESSRDSSVGDDFEMVSKPYPSPPRPQPWQKSFTMPAKQQQHPYTSVAGSFSRAGVTSEQCQKQSATNMFRQSDQLRVCGEDTPG